MTRVFVDTSAFIAVLNADDQYHAPARKAWIRALNEGYELVTTSYAIVETISLLQARFGIEAVHAFNSSILPLLAVEWVAAELHNTATVLLLALGRKAISLTDCVSSAFMRLEHISLVFAFDPHFKEQGFIDFAML